jgi:hypothetical protein
LNPGCPPSASYFNIADLAIVFEHDLSSLVNPPVDTFNYQYLAKVRPNHGLKLTLPQPSPLSPASKYAVIVHDFRPEDPEKSKLDELKVLICDLVQVKRVAALFVTDLSIGESDVFGDWSSFWPQFVAMVAEAGRASTYMH